MALSPELNTLRTNVSTNPDAAGSTNVLLRGIADRIEAVKTQPVKLSELAAELRAEGANFGQAVVTGTPHAAQGVSRPVGTPNPNANSDRNPNNDGDRNRDPNRDPKHDPKR